MIRREKLYKIGEIMHYTGLSRQTLHNYTLTGLIVEARRTQSGHRLYDESVFDCLEKIKELQHESYTLMQIKKIFEDEREQKILREKEQLSIDFNNSFE